MLFSIKIVNCMYNILNILSNSKSNYSRLYKETKVSHITLQRALKFLLERHLITIDKKGQKYSFYVINNKGKRYLILLKELKELD